MANAEHDRIRGLKLTDRQFEDYATLQRLTRRAFVAKSSAAVGLAALGSSFLAACGGSSSGSGSGSSAGATTSAAAPGTHTLTIASAGSWQGFDMSNSAFIANGPSLEIVQATCGTIVQVLLPPTLAAARAAAAAGKLNGQPALAASWKSLNGGAKWRFKLQPHAVSGFGNPLTVEDIHWSMQRYLAFPTAVGAFLIGLAGVKKASQITAVDSHTFDISLPAPPPAYFLQILGLPWLYMIDSTEAKKHTTKSDPWATKWLTTHTAGHGQYRLESAVANKSATLVPNAGYYGPKAQFAKIIQEGVDDQSARLQLLLTGSAQYAEELTALQLSQVASNASTQVTRFTSTRVAFLSMDNTKPPFNTPELRQAIARAIPYDEIIKTVYRGYAERWKSAFIPWFQGVTDKYWSFDTDPAAAKRGLASVQGMSVELSYVQGFGAGQQIAVLVQQALNAAGLKCTLNGLLRAVADKEKVAKPGIPFFIDDSDSPAAPHPLYNLQYMYTTTAFQNMAHYSNPTIDKLTGQLAKTQGLAAQNKIIDQCNKILTNDLPYIPVAYVGTIGAESKTISGVAGTEVGLVYYPDLKAVSG